MNVVFVCILASLVWQHHSQAAQIEGPGQAVVHIHLHPLTHVRHLYL